MSPGDWMSARTDTCNHTVPNLSAVLVLRAKAQIARAGFQFSLRAKALQVRAAELLSEHGGVSGAYALVAGIWRCALCLNDLPLQKHWRVEGPMHWPKRKEIVVAAGPGGQQGRQKSIRLRRAARCIVTAMPCGDRDDLIFVDGEGKPRDVSQIVEPIPRLRRAL